MINPFWVNVPLIVQSAVAQVSIFVFGGFAVFVLGGIMKKIVSRN